MQSAKRSTAALVISLVFFASAAFLFAMTLLLTLTAFLPLITGKEIQTESIILGFGFGFEAALLFTATYFCFQKYNLQPDADALTQFQLKSWHIIVLIGSTCVMLLLGYFISENKQINWLLLPVLTIPAVTFPIVLIFSLGAGNLQLGPSWRVWGVFGLGLTLVPLFSFLIEALILIVLFIMAILFLTSQPSYANEIVRLSNQIQHMQNDPQAIISVLAPYALKPGSITIVLAYISIFVPLTEELIKPLGIWLFAGKLASPAQGFALGALSGAAYALTETLGVSGQTSTWASLLLARIGTGLLHITATALMGWGIVSARKNREYLKLILIYFVSVAFHGTWNASAIMYSYAFLAKQYAPSNLLSSFAPITFAISIVLAGMLLIILVITNKRLNQTSHAEIPVIPENSPE